MSTKLKIGLTAAASAALLGATVTASAAQYANVVSATPVAAERPKPWPNWLPMTPPAIAPISAPAPDGCAWTRRSL